MQLSMFYIIWPSQKTLHKIVLFIIVHIEHH